MKSVPEQIAQISAAHPDRPAMRSGRAVLRYGDLAARAEDLAAGLAARGVGAGDVVAIGLPRSETALIAMLGIWKAGAAFLPLDPDQPPKRLLELLQDAVPKLVITDKDHAWPVPRTGVAAVPFETLVAGPPPPARGAVPSPADPAYVIFTSGSTGRPKGVAVSHGALAHFMAAIQQPLQLQPDDVFAALTTLSFDISILEMIGPLTQGACTAILDPAVTRDGKHLAGALAAHGATVIQATPATWRLLLEAGWEGGDGLTLICGGETLPRHLADRLLACSGRLYNAYGPTEATIWATLEPVQPGTGAVPIGTPLAGYKAIVLDQTLRPAAPGAEGQLYLGGPGLATGYVDRPDETALRFIDHPEFGRLYATGDLARQTGDGKLAFLGRADEQIKINGYRVEPGEIEAHLLDIGGVREALVMLRPDARDHDKLVAYLVAGDGADLAPPEIRRTLGARLPAYMVPHHIVALNSFPRTSNNKVDRRKLPDPQARAGAGGEAVAGPLETYLHEVWSEVLGLPRIGRSENFFDMGGDSLQAAHVTNRIEERLGEIVWPVVLFDTPTIAALADYLHRTYPAAVARQGLSGQGPAVAASDRVVDEAMIAAFRALTKPLAPFPAPTRKNPRAVFILCPPRSGSTLLRAMLAGHPGLFAPPEIELLTFNTLQDRAEVFSGREHYRREGLIRAVMEIKACDVEAAWALMADYERQNVSVPAFYGLLQSWLPGRMLIEKTPANTLDPAALRRIEAYFEDPLYIHLKRHPLGMINSFLEARLSEVFFRREPHGFSPRELAELIWHAAHDNTRAVLAGVPDARKFALSFEDLTRDPEDTLSRICAFLGVEPTPEMLTPWENRKARMADGLHPESKMMGDPKFHRHTSIDLSAADRWRGQLEIQSLGLPTRRLALELGYAEFEGLMDATDDREEFVL